VPDGDADAMVVATESAGGEPSSRFVILRGFDRRGFVFFTNYDSPKARDLAENPRAAVLFYWAPLDPPGARLGPRVEAVGGRVGECSGAASPSPFLSTQPPVIWRDSERRTQP